MSSTPGEMFQKRRAAAASKQQGDDVGNSQARNNNSNANANNNNNNNNNVKKSFLEIQAEQERNSSSFKPTLLQRDRSQPQNQQRNSSNSYNNNNNNSYGNDTGRRSSSNRRSNNNSAPHYKDFPVELGIVCALRDSFGFIHCADRIAEVFFHYSSVDKSTIHPDDLQIDLEVQFQVGPSLKDPSQLAAYEVRPYNQQIQWEIPEQGTFQGKVDKVARSGRGDPTEGTINIIKDEAEDKATASDQDDLTVKYLPNAYAPSNNNKKGAPSNRLGKNDIVEFTIVTDRRSQQKFARDIQLVQSDRERQQQEYEAQQLAQAPWEQGIVLSLKSQVIRSNKRPTNISFHSSNAEVPLEEGQEVEFKVIVPQQSDDKPSAREIKLLPKGTVIFRKMVATQLMGVVTVCPKPPISGSGRNSNNNSNNNSNKKGNNDGDSRNSMGKLQLLEPFAIDTDTNVTEVAFFWNQAPGGIQYAPSIGRCPPKESDNGVWVKNGDIFSFDLVHEFANDNYQAVAPNQEKDLEKLPELPNTQPLKLAELNMAGRYEGVIHVLKDSGGYGFIQFSERPIDVHFKYTDILPDVIHSAILPGPTSELKIGASVSFDLVCQPSKPSFGRGRSPPRRGGGRGGGPAKNEREMVLAQRILLLPNAVSLETTFAEGVKGTIVKEEQKQLYAGTIELEQAIQDHMTLAERHPLVATLLDKFAKEVVKPNGRQTLVFPDPLPASEDNAIITMVEEMYADTLEVTHLQVAGFGEHPGRLCIRRLSESEEATLEENGEAPEDGATDGVPKADKHRKKKPAKKGSTNAFRFDKACLVDELKQDVPPGVGDVVVCDLIKVRRIGKIVARNIRVVERAERQEEEGTICTDSAIGIVKEVNSKRNFGFIHVLDEDSTKREMVFFNLTNVLKPEGNGRTMMIGKGDEVNFDIRAEKNGKRVAKNVKMLAKGTIPNQAAKNACFGVVLLEPSHTRLSDTPARKLRHAASTGSSDGAKPASRWNLTDEAPHKSHQKEIVEAGCILLLEDKTGMFDRRPGPPQKSKSSESMDAVESPAKDAETDTTPVSGTSTLLQHLHYKNGSIAIHGSGSATCVDGSSHPRRGDYVSFVKARTGRGVRDLRIVRREDAKLIRGRLENIQKNAEDASSVGTADFITTTEPEKVYKIDLAEVVSCDATLLKDKLAVEGILYEEKIYGVCRTTDLYLGTKLGSKIGSKIGTRNKERPKLNLTVKKDRAGTIMAQSMMAMGPDGTNGFAPGWTTRQNKFLNG